MNLRLTRSTGAIAGLALCAVAVLAAILHRRAAPAVVLWAWERPEKLDFIDPRQVGVAFLSRTLALAGDRVVVRPRLQPLSVPAGTHLIAVARVEVDSRAPATLSSAQQAALAEALLEMARRPALAGIQIDFDARRSERAFYAALLRDVRGRLPQRMPLSITALVSWCLGDPWIADLPIDEAVPMFFRMGPGALRAPSRPMLAVCRPSIGVSTDEVLPPLPARARVYVFHPRAWSAGAAEETLRRIQSWQ